MTTPVRRTLALLLAVAVSTGCVSDGDDDTDAGDGANPVNPEVSIVAPPERRTPFCQAMIELSLELLTDDVDDSTALVIETYRSILDEVPAQISADFTAVLAALEAGGPPPTDPPITTIAPASTSPPVAATTPADGSASGSTAPGAVGVDEGFAPSTSPAERINNYVDFACRGTSNNPGPPATPPLVD